MTDTLRQSRAPLYLQIAEVLRQDLDRGVCWKCGVMRRPLSWNTDKSLGASFTNTWRQCRTRSMGATSNQTTKAKALNSLNTSPHLEDRRGTETLGRSRNAGTLTAARISACLQILETATPERE